MTLTPWMHENAFLPGTIVRADAMNVKLDGIAQAIQAICNQINQKIPNLPATFTGETQIPEKTLPNTLLLINSAGAMDLYPKAQFDADVANAATAAAQAATSATTAQTLTNQAQVHEQNAEEYAEAAFNSAAAAAASAESAQQAKDDTMSALNTRLGTTGNLGTAAQRNVMNSPTDTTTPDALMPRGSFGAGSLGNAPSIANFNTYQPAGFYSAQPTTVGKPDPEGWGSYVASLGSSAADRAAYLIMRSGSVAMRAWLAKREGGTLSSAELYHTGNVVGPVSIGGGSLTGAVLQAVFLDGVTQYTKYADGVVDITITAVLSTSGSINLGSVGAFVYWGALTVGLPVSVVSIQSMNVTSVNHEAGPGAFGTSARVISLSQIQVYCYAGSVGAYSFSIRVKARWY